MKPTIEQLRSKFPLVTSPSPATRASVRAGSLVIGGEGFVVMAGPCAVESERQIMEAAEGVSRHGAQVLRGGAFKPRSSPYSFQGLGVEGLKLLRKSADANGLAVVTEVMCCEDIAAVAEYA